MLVTILPGPAPTHRPAFTTEQIVECRRVVRQHNAPQAHVARAKLALLLHDAPALDHPTAARRLGKHPNKEGRNPNDWTIAREYCERVEERLAA